MTDKPLSEEDEVEASRAPLLDHLAELRKRLLIALTAIVVCTAFAYAFAGQIFQFLVIPYTEALQDKGLLAAGEVPRLQITHPLEGFYTNLRLAILGGIMLAFPVVAWQAYAFIAPGLYRRERAAAAPYLIAAPLMFVAGAAFVYYVAMRFVMVFALGFQTTNEVVELELIPKMNEYFSLVSTLILAFGFCFQLPVVLTLLGSVGLVSAGFLRKGRRYAIVGIAAVAACISPPDVISMAMMALPMYALYEISIWLVWLMERARGAAEARAAAETAAAE